MSESARFWPKVDVGDCWLWTGAITGDGYGSFALDHSTSGKRNIGAHRWAWEHLVGPIPEGLQVDHLCRVRRCVNPDHMEIVSSMVNTRRGQAWSQPSEACRKAGHPMSGENVRVTRLASGRVRRTCRACERATKKMWRQRQKLSSGGDLSRGELVGSRDEPRDVMAVVASKYPAQGLHCLTTG